MTFTRIIQTITFALFAMPAHATLTPFPSSVPGVPSPVLPLDGTWEFSAKDGDAFRPIEVPGEWAMQGFEVPEKQFATYRRSFDLPADWAGGAVKLRFDAVHAVCKVAVNGQDVGAHEGGFVPFEIDITPALEFGASNDLTVRVQSESVADTISCISQYAAHQVGGILRGVTLFSVPKVHVSSLFVSTGFDDDFQDAMLRINLEIDARAAKGPGKAEIHLRLHQPAPPTTQSTNKGTLPTKEHPDANVRSPAFRRNRTQRESQTDGSHASLNTSPDISQTFHNRLKAEPQTPCSEPIEENQTVSWKRPGVIRKTIEIPVPNAKWWTPETPNLYDLEIEVGDHAIHQSVGFREIKIRGNELLVNGHPVKLMGVNRHEVHPLRGRSLTPELCRRDAVLFREANVNLVRTSHYPPSKAFLDACDELGIFVECEAAVCWIGHGASPIWAKGWDKNDPKFLPYFRRAALEMIAAHRNHPSIILWSPANESNWTPSFATVIEEMKAVDPTRPVVFHDQCWGNFNNFGAKADIANYHYPSESNTHMWSEAGRPVWFGEYAHLQCYNRRELVTDPGIRADWGRPLARMVDLMWKEPGCLGGAIWSGIDDVFHMPDGDLKGYGHWGPIDGWRRKKPEWFGMRRAYAPFKILEAHVPDQGAIRLKIQNRFNFTDLSDCDISWKCVEPSPKMSDPSDIQRHPLKIDLPPHAIGEITIPAPAQSPGHAILLTVRAPDGSVVIRNLIGNRPHADAIELPSKAGTPAANIEGNKIVLGSRGNLTLPAPAPMVLPLNGKGGTETAAGTQLTNEIPAFTPMPADWNPKIRESDGDLLIEGKTDTVNGWIRIHPVGGVNTAPMPHDFTVSYEFELLADVNPRQWGLVFTLPRSFDTLKWQRETRIAWHTPEEIDRAEGSAKANPVDRMLLEEPGVEPKTPWPLDANALGTNDFRSTKINIITAGLADADKHSITIEPAGKDGKDQSVRAWVDGDHIRLLVAAFNTGGADSFFDTHYSAERRPLKKGDKIRSDFRVSVP